MAEKGVFATLSAIDVSGKLKKKNGMSYLPWSSAWAIIKEHYPDATYEAIKTEDGCLYHTDSKTCWVETSLNIAGETQHETLAVMNHRNQSISADEVTSVDFGRSIKRCLVKNAALFGLGLSLWNGEELSDAAKQTRAKKQAEDAAAEKEKKKAEAVLADANSKIIELCKSKIADGVAQDTLYAIVAKYTGGKKNPNAITTLEESEDCYKEIEAMKAKGEK